MADGSPTRRAGARTTRFVQDVFQQSGGVAIVGACAVVFVLAAVGGLTLRSSLGTFGWIAYAIVLGVLALALGPVIATGMTLRQKGSARHRDAHAERLAAQRKKFALVSHEAEAKAKRADEDSSRRPE